ncbi:MAG: hypothetical protein R3A80_09900 [Bdellovibrionota bacterium]
MKRAELEKLARKKAEKLRAKFSDPRYKKVIGKFVAAGLLEHNKVGAYRGHITLDEVIWVGQIEPRVLELLPAIILRRPKLIDVRSEIPEDLRLLLIQLRKGLAIDDFRGIAPALYLPWVNRLGRKAAAPSVLKTFRFQRKDIEKINELKKRTGLNETEIIRKALQSL